MVDLVPSARSAFSISDPVEVLDRAPISGNALNVDDSISHGSTVSSESLLDAVDIAAFISCETNLNGDGDSDADDFFAYLDRFAAGCV